MNACFSVYKCTGIAVATGSTESFGVCQSTSSAWKHKLHVFLNEPHPMAQYIVQHRMFHVGVFCSTVANIWFLTIWNVPGSGLGYAWTEVCVYVYVCIGVHACGGVIQDMHAYITYTSGVRVQHTYLRALAIHTFSYSPLPPYPPPPLRTHARTHSHPQIFNWLILSAYLAETLLRINAMTFRLYWRQLWPDFILVTINITGEFALSPFSTTVIQSVRTLRVLRVISAHDALKRITLTLITCTMKLLVPSLGVFITVFYIYAVVGVSCFSAVHPPEIEEIPEGFDSFGHALLALFQVHCLVCIFRSLVCLCLGMGVCVYVCGCVYAYRCM